MQIFPHFFQVFLEYFFRSNNPPLWRDNSGLLTVNEGLSILKFNV